MRLHKLRGAINRTVTRLMYSVSSVVQKFTKNSQFLHILFTIIFPNIFNNQMKQTLNTMKKVFLILIILLQLFNNFAICGTISSNDSTSFGNTKNIISRFFDVIRSAVDFSGLGNSIKNRVEDKKEEPVNSDKGIYLVITLNTISSLTIIFLQSMLVFLGFVNLLKVRGYRVGGRRYILMFLLILYLSMYKFVYYAPRSSISDCVIYLISGVLISSRLSGMKLGSYRGDGKCVDVWMGKCVDSVRNSYLLFTNHQTLISNTYFLTPNYKPLVPNISRFNSASWFFTPYHPLDPPYHEAGLNLLKSVDGLMG